MLTNLGGGQQRESPSSSRRVPAATAAAPAAAEGRSLGAKAGERTFLYPLGADVAGKAVPGRMPGGLVTVPKLGIEKPMRHVRSLPLFPLPSDAAAPRAS